MKRILFFAVIVAVLASCSFSPVKKANALIEENVKKTLFYAESYDPVETVVDSAFAPFDDPVFYQSTLDIYKALSEFTRLSELARKEQTTMTLWSGPYTTAFERNKYKEAKENYESALKQKDRIGRKLIKVAEEYKEILQKEVRFIGFKAVHRFRAQNKEKEVFFCEYKFLFDENLTKVVAMWDTDSDEYKFVLNVYEEIMESINDRESFWQNNDSIND